MGEITIHVTDLKILSKSIRPLPVVKEVTDAKGDKTTYDARPNKAAFMYDDGMGNLLGFGSGRVNYETGEINFTALPDAEFVVNLIHKSAHAGGVNADTTSGKNTIQSIGARCVNPKLNTTVKVLAYN